MKNACCYTGYRPHKLPWGGNEADPRCDQLKKRLFCETLHLADEGVNVFLSGMARGVDIWAAEEVIKIRQVKISLGIELWAVIPYERQAEAWPIEEQERYQRILSKADKVIQISKEYTRSCLHERNRYMVDHASHMIAVYDGKPGGTESTIGYARKKGLSITIIEP